jgi:lipopolysaccharide/colanic/teichoic acid biosynthesis glycosyltransferase
MQRTDYYLTHMMVFLERGLKRLVDVLFSGIFLIVLSLFILLIAFLIKLNSPGPIIYRHVRVGKDGQNFNLYKFRSMSVGGDDQGFLEYLKQLIESDQSDSRKGIPYCKMDGDSRWLIAMAT